MGWMHDSKIFLKNSKYFLFFGLAKVGGSNVEILIKINVLSMDFHQYYNVNVPIIQRSNPQLSRVRKI